MLTFATRLIELMERRPDADELADYLLANVCGLQRELCKVQSAGLRYAEVIVPRRFAGVVGDTAPTILGRRIIAGDVETIGVVIRP